MLLYGVGAGMLVAEIFIPSHGILTVVGLGFLAAAVAKTFSYAGETVGVVAILGCAVALPTFAFVCIKYWPHTPIGRKIAPPNPVLTAADGEARIQEFRALIGQTGRALSPLRPVGICDFNGRRIPCVAEWGVVETAETVVATGIKSGNLAVRAKTV